MLTSSHILAIISFLPLSLSAILQPAFNPFHHVSRQALSSPGRSAYDDRKLHDGPLYRVLPRKRLTETSKARWRPEVQVGGVDIGVYSRDKQDDLGRRELRNGSIIDLGTSLE